MTAFTLLIICLMAQILIAGGLGIYLLRRHFRERRKGESPVLSDEPPSKEKKRWKGDRK